jgi:hypothetical protein
MIGFDVLKELRAHAKRNSAAGNLPSDSEQAQIRDAYDRGVQCLSDRVSAHKKLKHPNGEPLDWTSRDSIETNLEHLITALEREYQHRQTIG